jgi:hypothetical protein
MEINKASIEEYKTIIQSTNLQIGYQELIKFFRYLRVYLEKEMTGFKFTGNIVENNMDYSYFQFTAEEFSEKGLKIVVAFIHKEFIYEVWLSGGNRKIQSDYHAKLSGSPQIYALTNDPNRTDYILKKEIDVEYDYDDLDRLLVDMKKSISIFIEDMKKTCIDA